MFDYKKYNNFIVKTFDKVYVKDVQRAWESLSSLMESHLKEMLKKRRGPTERVVSIDIDKASLKKAKKSIVSYYGSIELKEPILGAITLSDGTIVRFKAVGPYGEVEFSDENLNKGAFITFIPMEHPLRKFMIGSLIDAFDTIADYFVKTLADLVETETEYQLKLADRGIKAFREKRMGAFGLRDNDLALTEIFKAALDNKPEKILSLIEKYRNLFSEKNMMVGPDDLQKENNSVSKLFYFPFAKQQIDVVSGYHSGENFEVNEFIEMLKVHDMNENFEPVLERMLKFTGEL